MSPWFEVFGLFPTILYPVAKLVQIHKIWATRKIEGVSFAFWYMFALANSCGFVYCIGHEIWMFAASGFFTGLLDIVAIYLLLRIRSKERKNQSV